MSEKVNNDFNIEFLDHVAIRVKDVTLSAKWYADVLGLKKVQLEKWGPYPLFMLSGKSGVALFPANSNKASTTSEKPNGGIDHFAFQVTAQNFEKAIKKYAALHIEYTIQDHHYFQSLYVKDPDGHTVELTTIKVDPNIFYEGLIS